jgi:histidinol dehydrogenase
VKLRGDAAVLEIHLRVDRVVRAMAELQIPRLELEQAFAGLPRAAEATCTRWPISFQHERQVWPLGYEADTLGSRSACSRVGIYVPVAGCYPSSVLMNALPAR